jgi:DNA-directed RNA polymerase alpha subunit
VAVSYWSERGLDVRTENMLLNNGILYVEDLAKLNRWDLYKIKNCGRKTAQVLLDVVRRAGLSMPGRHREHWIADVYAARRPTVRIRYHLFGGLE